MENYKGLDILKQRCCTLLSVVLFVAPENGFRGLELFASRVPQAGWESDIQDSSTSVCPPRNNGSGGCSHPRGSPAFFHQQWVWKFHEPANVENRREKQTRGGSCLEERPGKGWGEQECRDECPVEPVRSQESTQLIHTPSIHPSIHFVYLLLSTHGWEGDKEETLICLFVKRFGWHFMQMSVMKRSECLYCPCTVMSSTTAVSSAVV